MMISNPKSMSISQSGLQIFPDIRSSCTKNMLAEGEKTFSVDSQLPKRGENRTSRNV